MNLGANILALRKKKSVTQEELAAELGVTAAAVSKWEHGYTLPDVLMLCALADFFDVTTDDLLGRANPGKNALVVAQTEELGQKIADLIKQYNISTAVILTDYEMALAVAEYETEHKNEIQYLFSAMEHPLEEREMNDSHGLVHVDVQQTGGNDEDVLHGIEVYLKNMDAFKNIADLATKNSPL